jgi:heptaprenyl diphosphate synthase
LSSAAYLGARVGGADVELASQLRRYGTAFGMAFQLVDDLLDLLGDERVIGKPVGTDLKEGVYTLPLLHGMEQRADVAEMIRTEIDLGSLVEALHETGSFGYARTVAEEYATKAMSIVRGLPACDERDCLEALVDFVVARIPISSAA